MLGVDLDGVCGDHTAAFRQVVAAELGVDPASLGPQVAWDYHAWGVDDEAFLRLHQKAVLEYRMFRTMPPMEGVAEALWSLSDAGVWIRLITHRLYANWGHQVAVSDTVAWLDEHGIPYRDLCLLGDKPQVEADAYIEDAPHNIEALRAKFGRTAGWSEGEQAAVSEADEATLRALGEANLAYEERFGHLFIVCASGLSAGEMLARLKDRMGHNEPAYELRVAAGEQAKITRLRLDKLDLPEDET